LLNTATILSTAAVVVVVSVAWARTRPGAKGGKFKSLAFKRLTKLRRLRGRLLTARRRMRSNAAAPPNDQIRMRVARQRCGMTLSCRYTATRLGAFFHIDTGFTVRCRRLNRTRALTLGQCAQPNSSDRKSRSRTPTSQPLSPGCLQFRIRAGQKPRRRQFLLGLRRRDRRLGLPAAEQSRSAYHPVGDVAGRYRLPRSIALSQRPIAPCSESRMGTAEFLRSHGRTTSTGPLSTGPGRRPRPIRCHSSSARSISADRRTFDQWAVHRRL